MTARLKHFLARYHQAKEVAKTLKELRRKHRRGFYQKHGRNPSPIGASAEEIAAWAKAMVARRETKKRRKS